MRLELTGRHVDTTPALRRLVDRKLARLARLLNDSALSAQVVLSREKHVRRADVTLHARGEKFLHGVGESATWELSLSQAADKIAQQAQRVKGKWQERKRQDTKRVAASQPADGMPGDRVSAPRKQAVRTRMPRILRTTRQPLKPMSISDAAREIELNGDGVVVFRDAETAAISVLYRRTNGELTLVETEM
jgi:putative sigma-54 modulation protein